MVDVVCGVIANERGAVLACRRRIGSHLGGKWEFPGGKIEAGESPEDALLRELREELAVDVLVGAPLAPVIWKYPMTTIRLLPFHCRITRGELQALEHDELRWCSAEDATALNWADADRPILHELFPSGPA